jgi:hypothetical protein
MLPYTDDNRNWQSIRLSEALALLARSTPGLDSFHPKIIDSLLNHCVHYLHQEIQPGRRLYGVLQEIHII